MSDSLLPCVEVNPSQPHDAVVIWLHGLGDSGNGFAPIVPQLNIPEDFAIRFVFPHAPVRPVTINNGFEMRAWYDIKSMNFEDRADRAGVEESVKLVEQLIQAEIDKGISPQRIVLAGFSQGGVIAYHLGLRFAHQLAGLMCLSTYMCDNEEDEKDWQQTNIGTPILVGHGKWDDVVPPELGKLAYSRLQARGYNIEWQEYPMQHNVCLEQTQYISKWLQNCFKRA